MPTIYHMAACSLCVTSEAAMPLEALRSGCCHPQQVLQVIGIPEARSHIVPAQLANGLTLA